VKRNISYYEYISTTSNSAGLSITGTGDKMHTQLKQ